MGGVMVWWEVRWWCGVGTDGGGVGGVMEVGWEV